MLDIQRKELERCVKFIEAIGCEFKVIADDGTEYGTLEVKPKVDSTRAPRRYPYGAVAKHFRAQLRTDSTVGDVQVVECGEFDPEAVRSGMCSDLTNAWGKDTYITSVVNKTVEVLRTA